MKQWIQPFLNKEFILFLIIGVINTLNGTLFSVLFSNIFNANIAFVCGYLCGLLIAYLLNSFFTFHETLSLQKGLRFAVSYIPNFIIQNVFVFFIYNLMHYDKLFAYLIAAIIGIPVTFLLLKVFAFKSNTTTAYKENL